MVLSPRRRVVAVARSAWPLPGRSKKDSDRRSSQEGRSLSGRPPKAACGATVRAHKKPVPVYGKERSRVFPNRGSRYRLAHKVALYRVRSNTIGKRGLRLGFSAHLRTAMLTGQMPRAGG